MAEVIDEESLSILVLADAMGRSPFSHALRTLSKKIGILLFIPVLTIPLLDIFNRFDTLNLPTYYNERTILLSNPHNPNNERNFALWDRNRIDLLTNLKHTK